MSDVLTTFFALIDALTEQRDAEAAIALYATDEDVVFSGSTQDEVGFGPEAVAAVLRAIVASPTRLSLSPERRQVREEDNVAWANITGRIRVEEPGTAPRDAPYRITAIFVRRDGAWRWHTFNGSEPV